MTTTFNMVLSAWSGEACNIDMCCSHVVVSSCAVLMQSIVPASQTCLQAAGLLAAVQLQPQDEADVERIKKRGEEAQAAAAAAEEACEELEESCRARLRYATPADAEAMREELAHIGEVQTAWRQLAAAASERLAHGVELAPPPPVSTSEATTAPSGTPSAASSRLGSARLVRQGSTASVASSAGGRAKQSRDASRAAKEAA